MDKKSRGKKKSRGTRERASKILGALCRVYLAERAGEYEHTDDGEEAARGRRRRRRTL